jgi:hypothetical protein
MRYPLLYVCIFDRSSWNPRWDMFEIRQFAVLTFASLALAISVGTASPQPDGTRMGEWGWGQGMMGPGMTLRSGAYANTLCHPKNEGGRRGTTGQRKCYATPEFRSACLS